MATDARCFTWNNLTQFDAPGTCGLFHVEHCAQTLNLAVRNQHGAECPSRISFGLVPIAAGAPSAYSFLSPIRRNLLSECGMGTASRHLHPETAFTLPTSPAPIQSITLLAAIVSDAAQPRRFS